MRRVALVFAILALAWSGGAVRAASPSPSAEPSASPVEPPAITWTRAALPADVGAPVELAWGGRGLLLLAQADTADRPALWWSATGEDWTPTSGSLTAADATLEHVSAGFDALAVSGRIAGAPALWWSRDGTTWERASRTDLGRMAGVAVRSFGDRFWAPMTAYTDEGSWSSRNGRLWRAHQAMPGGDPTADAHLTLTGDATLEAVLSGRDGFLAVVEIGDGFASLASRNRQDWTPVDPPPAGSRAASAFASDGGLMAVHRVDGDGAHTLSVSTDGLRWFDSVADGDLPMGADPRLAMRFGALVLATDQGVWVGRFARHPGADIPTPAGPGAPPALGPIGAVPPLRPPVQSSGRTIRPDLARPADDSAQGGGLRLELWVPHAKIRAGDRLLVHAQATNVGGRPIALSCPSFGVRGDLTALFPAGSAWTGHAAELAASALRERFASLWFPRADALGRFCEGGSVGRSVVLQPGERMDGDSVHLVRAPLGDQALPGGRLPITAEVRTGEWERSDGGRTPTLRVGAPVTVRGPAWSWPGPAQIVDAVLSDPRVADAVARTTSGWVAESDMERVLERHPGLVLPPGADPDALLVLQLWLSPMLGGGSFLILDVVVDPWTAQVIDVRPS